jgi:hypothetical protein
MGRAVCHDDDMEFASEYTGCSIAEMRAEIERLQDIKNNEIKPGLKSLKHLESCIVENKNFNPKSYEFRLLRRQIRKFENDLTTINKNIAETKNYLKDYILAKEKINQKLIKGKKD